MDNEQFLQHLRDLSLEEGRGYIQGHISEVSDYAAVGNLLADEALRLLYTPFVSLKLAELLIFFGEYVQHTLSHALGLKAKGDALQRIGHHKAAMEYLDTAGEEFLRLGDEGNWARSRITWITSCSWLGHVEEAIQEGIRARDVFLRQGENYWVYIINSNLAVIYAQTGRYQNALNLYEVMLTIFPTLTNQSETFIKRAIAIAQANRGEILSWLGKFEEAQRLLQKAQVGFISLEETSLVIYTEISLADIDYTQGYYGSALRRYYQARDILMQNKLNDPLLLAELKLWMANCLVKLNRAQEACQLVSEAVEVYRQLGTSLQASNALREYATTLVASGRLKEALVALDEASALFSYGSFEHYTSATKLQQTELLLEMGSYTAAYEQARMIKEYFEAQGLVSRSLRTSLVMAGALIESTQQAQLISREEEQQPLPIEDAALLCEQVTHVAHKHNLQEQIYKSQYLLGKLAAKQGDLSRAARYYRVAINQVEQILDNLVYDLSPSFLHTTWVAYEDMIALCLQRGQAERAFSYLERARSMALRQYLNKSKTFLNEREVQGNTTSTPVLQANGATVLRMQSELKEWQEKYRNYSVLLANIDTTVSPTVNQEIIEAELKRCEAKVSELFERLHLYQADRSVPLHISRPGKRVNSAYAKHATQRIDIKQLRQHLSSNQLLLAYFLYRGRLVTFAITPERLITHENPSGVEQLERLLPLLHAHLDPRGWSDFQRPLQEPVRRLLQKLYDLLVAPVASLLPSPTGHLTIVPYGPLHKLPFHALHDGSHYLVENYQVSYLPACNVLMHLDTHRSKLDVHLVDSGVSTRLPVVFAYSENGHLQRVRDEGRTVASLLDGKCYLEGEATIARLTEEAPGSPILHLATHGHARLDAPNFSYVRLADGQLNAIDAFNLDLEGCELVTLSGCETGLALSGGGDEQLGLGRAFLAAGAKSLVMSLWPVEDTSTNELMQLFYQNLLKGGTKAEALRAAQCDLLLRTSSIYTHPYFWAAFRLVGDIGHLVYNGAKDHVFALKTEVLKR